LGGQVEKPHEDDRCGVGGDAFGQGVEKRDIYVAGKEEAHAYAGEKGIDPRLRRVEGGDRDTYDEDGVSEASRNDDCEFRVCVQDL